MSCSNDEQNCGIPTRKMLNIKMPSFGTPITTSEENILDQNSNTSLNQASHYATAQSEIMLTSDHKISKLAKKTSEMRGEVDERQKNIEETFENVKMKIYQSATDLESTRNRLEGIQFKYQKDLLNANKKVEFSFLNNPELSIEQLNSQMDEIQKKLSTLQEKTKNFKKTLQDKNASNETLYTSLPEAVEKISKIGKGDYDS
uniref:Uncharacterized protein n=1 Tax=Photinus pyralis TaxID=7054 RepID=A0A1Y1L1K3_PHOPY